MHIRGKVHNPENADLAKELCELCDRTPLLQLPSANMLNAPVRSNRTGRPLTEGSLTNEVVDVILASRCEWYTLLTELAKDLDLTGRRAHLIATFGIGDCIPLLPFHRLQLQITKLDVLSFIKENQPSMREPGLGDNYSFPNDSVAIIGASCRLPGANNLDELWDMISSGQSQHTEVPTDRFDLPGSFRASQDWKFAGKRKFYGNFIDNVGNFDNSFFGTNPKEALNMDPQQRILLELAYQAVESSGYLRSHQRESGDAVGCFLGASFVEYLDNTNCNPPTAYTSTGTIRAFLSGKISYHFGWSGPSEVLDTACSSSLVAINRACKAVQTGECTMALTGGINIMTGMNNFLDLAKAGFLSPTGQCKPFDASADGYCRSEGGGLVLLKLLNQAVVDGDQILGVIPGVSTNQGGLSASLTIPHSPAQKKLYQTVLRQASMEAEQVTYVETHGTGTQAGDPLEIASVRDVFGSPERSSFLNVGSLKGNIGHCETAAGVASLLKVLAMIKHGGIPPQASHKSLNPKIPELEPDKMCISSKADTWNAPLLAACINSYGAAGSNCALICCEGPQPKTVKPEVPTDIDEEPAYPLTISAASKASLYANVEGLGQYIAKIVPRPKLGDLAFTLSERRKRDRYCFFATATEVTGLIESLRMIRNDPSASSEVPSKSKPVVLVFGGQSKQNVGCNKGLYQHYPHFRSYIDSCNDIVMRLGFSSILPAIFQSEQIENVITLQCGTFAMQYACASCWIDSGLEVQAVVGHSFGELTALVISGVLSLYDGLKLIAVRASLMDSKWGLEKGTMLAIHSNLDVVNAIAAEVNLNADEPHVEVACYNSPSSQVLVGSISSITKVENLLKDNKRFQGVRFQRVNVTHGFHSKFTTAILGDLKQTSEALTFRDAEIPLETCTAAHLDHVLSDRPAIHAREPVYFVNAIRRIEERLGASIWLEAGMDSPIVPMVKKAVENPNNHVFLAMKMQDAQPPTSNLSDLIINLWHQGVKTSHWSFISRKEHSFKQVWLPPYQFQPTSHWLANIDRVIEVQQKMPEPMKLEPQAAEEPSKLVTYDQATGNFRVHVGSQRFKKIVSGHAVRQRPLCPAAMYMESAAMAIQISQGDFDADSLYFGDLVFLASLGVDLDREVVLILTPTKESRSWDFLVKSSLRSDPKSRSTTHAKGRIGLTTPPRFDTYERLISDSISQLQKSGTAEKLMSKRAYGLFALVVHYADFLQGMTTILLDGTQAVAEVDIPLRDLGANESTVTQACDTVALDVFIQVVGLLINSSDMVTKEEVYVATGVDHTSMSSGCDLHNCKSWTVYTKFKPMGNDRAAGDIFVLTRDGALVMTITGVQFTKLLISKLEKFLDSANPKASVPISILKASPSSSDLDLVGGSDTTPGLTSRTSTSSATSDVDDEDEADGDAKDLKIIIGDYTGLSAADIAEDANIGDLGVDSLAAVELAEELQSAFGKEIEAENLLAINYAELAKLCERPPSAKKASKSKATLLAQSAGEPVAASVSNPKTKSSQRLQDLFKLLSETSGAPAASIEQGATLQEIGVDSLSAVELKDDIEDAFSVTIEDDRFTLDSTVKEIVDFLGINASEVSTSTPKTASSSPAIENEKSSSGQSSKALVLANPIEALKQCEGTFNNAASKRGFLDYWTRVAPKQDELLLAYISEAFQALGSDLQRTPSGKEIHIFKHLPKHDKVMRRFIEILEKHNIISKQGASFIRLDGTLPNQTAQVLHESFVSQFPRYGGEARLMALTGPKLADCLIGKADAVPLLFKGAPAQKIMEDYYCNSPMLSTLTEQMVTFMSAIAAGSDATMSSPIRVLEVGAGFGGTTTRLAEVIQASATPVEYTFTDIAPSLIKGAKIKFAQYDWMKFQTFNLENEPPSSLLGQFDIIVGTNCVHATTNKTASVGRLKKMLRKNGFIVLSEVTQLIDWYDIVFGLLDGWWLA